MSEDFEKAFAEISHYYGGRKAERSGVLLMNHINEGVAILRAIQAPYICDAAFCLHPLVQRDGWPTDKWRFDDHNPEVIRLAREYARGANAYLCRPETDHVTTPAQAYARMGDLSAAAWLMLYADKIQNYKDFRQYHKGTHPRSEQLDRYFLIWLDMIRYELDMNTMWEQI